MSIGIARLIFALLVVNHFIACAWYGVGQLSPDGWTKQLDGESLTYKYLTSVHWSVAQFQSSMDIHAQNEAERIYSIIVVLIALVLFSSFLSSITNSTAQLQRHRREYTNRQRVIREYLKEHNVSPEMSVRVKAHGVRKMKTLWGSCNVRTHRIWLNLELARMSEKCIEAILVHEMVHLKERLHNHRFYGFMNTYLPDWMEREKELKEIGVRYY